ncbi:MAG TPA: sulfoxide reductase heme-binding subunit YedZ [Acidobacteria bacterium]|nr:sulfoxide reductase heme-binding subunit YedZ [Acidobacteriota bacterium]HIN33522.1 sulfoxide reductase heme-binding subunit YedZ [Nitrospirales bacterium]
MRSAKTLVFCLCLVPALVLVWDSVTGGLSVNPIEDITHRTGDWSLRFVLLTLAVTPFRWLSGWNEVIRYRRMLGLFTFWYASLHFSTYIVFDHFFDIRSIADDVIERKYVTAGFLGFVLMLPLAVTSTQGWIRRLGKRWSVLHRLIYVAAVAGVVHFLWLVKLETSEPLVYAAVLSGLFLVRVVRRKLTRAAGHRVPSGETPATF